MEETGLYYLRVDNLGANGSVVGEMKWLTQQTFDALERYRVFTDDVLISIAGTIGRITVFNEEISQGPTILTENCAKLHIVDGILPQYLMLLLLSRPLQKQMARDYIQTTIPKLGLDRIRQLRMPPIPEISRQERVISEWEASLQKFNRTKEKAHDLLASIDNYLLTELGITLPLEPENTIANRIFTVQRRELAGWRFDPYYFNIQFHTLEQAVDAGSYSTVSLNRLFLSMNNGIDCRDFVEDGIPYVKVADVRAFEISPNKAQKVPVTAVPERGIVRKGELLLTRKGSFGIAALVDHNDSFAISSEVFRIELDNSKVSGEYLVTLLNSQLCQSQFDREKIGAIMGSLTQAALSRIHIPLPPLAKQKSIAEFANSIRLRSKQLIAEAENELETAKRRIEAMLLGEVEV
ncbi:type I restriction enzyme S subunit [Methylobacter tundripaludum]|uniref:Type I restriction enzyme S subunit n=2 Tax=Methylobacter tundripaludum TaxID=173365 RepID=A0A2S6H8V0_9GAMM|nr:type I restriction enzyme S subunit [Methylobacter tundripaludum]